MFILTAVGKRVVASNSEPWTGVCARAFIVNAQVG